MNANATHPLAKLASAEATLISTIDAATARLNTVGTSSLDAALERLRSAAHAASARLQDAGAIVASIAGDVLEHLLGVSAGIESAMGRGDAIAPVESAIGYTIEERAMPEVEPAPRRTGFPIADAFLDIAREAEAETPAEPQTPREKYPAAPAAFSPDGPTLFDDAGNHTVDPTEVLLGAKAVPYAPGVPVARPGANGDAGAGHAGAAPQRRRKGR
jgi:hypothetical protein